MALIALSVGPCRFTVAVHRAATLGFCCKQRRQTPHIVLTTPTACIGIVRLILSVLRRIKGT
jgi:hypothetical protein